MRCILKIDLIKRVRLGWHLAADSKYSSINTMRFQSFSSTASALYNAVPPDIKSIPTLDKFKAALDSFLHSVPDTPPTPGYTGANGNSLLEWAGSKSQ
ncbi:unnamed protein product [Arctogadus glacialis]